MDAPTKTPLCDGCRERPATLVEVDTWYYFCQQCVDKNGTSNRTVPLKLPRTSYLAKLFRRRRPA